MNRQIKIGAILSYLSLAISALLALIYLPWMVSVIGKSHYALYTLSLSIISIFMVDFGLSIATSRFIAKYIAEGNNYKINDFVCTVETLYTIISFVIFIMLVICYYFLDRIYTGLSPEELETLKMLYIIVMIYSVVSFPCMPFSGILSAYEKFIELKICDLLQKTLVSILTVISLLNGGGVKAVVLCNAISGILVIVARVFIIYKKTPVKIKVGKIDFSLVREVFSFSIWITIISLAQRCIFNIAPSVLGVVSDSGEIAIFAPANTLESFFFMLSSAVNGLFLPMISRYIAENDKSKIFQLMVKVGRYQFVFLSLAFVGFVSVGEEFMIAWMGMDFINTYPCVLFLFFPDIFLATQQIANTVAIAKNKVKQQVLGYIGMAIICCILSFILCGNMGALGSAIAISLSYAFLFFYLSIRYKIDLNIDMIGFFKMCYFDLGGVVCCAAFFSYIACKYIIIDSIWLSVIIKLLVTTIIYGVIVSFKLNDDEKNFINKHLMKLK